LVFDEVEVVLSRESDNIINKLREFTHLHQISQSTAERMTDQSEFEKALVFYESVDGGVVCS
jgi:hypothetical protein